MLDTNDFKAKSFRLTFNNNTCVFSLNSEKEKQQVTCGVHKWVEQKNDKKGTPFPVAGRMEVPTALAASVTWIDDNTLLMTLRLIESAHTNGFTFAFEGNNVTVKFHSSISQGNQNAPEKRPDLKGSFIA